jgi:hypothetical protein
VALLAVALLATNQSENTISNGLHKADVSKNSNLHTLQRVSGNSQQSLAGYCCFYCQLFHYVHQANPFLSNLAHCR